MNFVRSMCSGQELSDRKGFCTYVCVSPGAKGSGIELTVYFNPGIFAGFPEA